LDALTIVILLLVVLWLAGFGFHVGGGLIHLLLVVAVVVLIVPAAVHEELVMPYASKAQQVLFHSANSPVSKKEVAKFDKDSKGQKGLPEHKKKPNPKKSAFRAQALKADNGEA
jgi:hypothetical protein